MSGGKKLPVEKAIRCSASLVILLRRAAVLHEHALQFLPDIFDGEDAEIDADLGEDVADGAMTELVRDFLGCGECRRERNRRCRAALVRGGCVVCAPRVRGGRELPAGALAAWLGAPRPCADRA